MNERIKLAAILIFFEIVSYLTLSLTPRDESYYLVALVFSYLIIFVFSKTSKSHLTLILTSLAFLVLLVQILGYAFYHLKFPIWIYNNAIHLLLASQFALLFTDWIIDVRKKNVSANTFHHRDIFSSLKNFTKEPK
jgi:hypothetical protein